MVKWFIFIFLICLAGVVTVLFKSVVRVKDGYVGYVIGKGVPGQKLLNPGDWTIVIPFIQQFYTIKNFEYEVKIPPNENVVENKEETQQGMDARFFRCKDNDYVRIQFFIKFRIDLNAVVNDNVYRYKYSNENTDDITHDVYIISRHYIDTVISGISRHEALHREDWKKDLESKIKDALEKRFLILTEFGTYGKNKHDPFSQAEFRTHQELENLENELIVSRKKHENVLKIQEMEHLEMLDKTQRESKIKLATTEAQFESDVAIAILKDKNNDQIILGLEADTAQEVARLNARTKEKEASALYELAQQKVELTRAETNKKTKIMHLEVEAARSDIEIKKLSAHTDNQVKVIDAKGKAVEKLKPDSWNVIGGSNDSGFNMVAHALKVLDCYKTDGFMSPDICDTWSQRIIGSAYNVEQKDIQIRTQQDFKRRADSEVREYVDKTFIRHCVPNVSESNIDDIQLSDEDCMFGEILLDVAKQINKVLGWDNMVSCVKQVLAIRENK